MRLRLRHKAKGEGLKAKGSFQPSAISGQLSAFSEKHLVSILVKELL